MKSQGIYRLLILTALFICVIPISCNKDDGEEVKCETKTFYLDADKDSFGDSSKTVESCTKPTTGNYAEQGGDTDDTNPGIFPGCTKKIYYKDNDEDGFGDSDSAVESCVKPEDGVYVEKGGDTDDSNKAIYPDCPQLTFYLDADEDGFGDPKTAEQACVNPDETKYVTNGDDLNDEDTNITTNCLQITFYFDGDGDGFGNPEISVAACENPDANKWVENGDDLDDTNEGVTNTCVQNTYYADFDNDKFGDPNNTIKACEKPDKYVEDDRDCDDTNPNINPKTDLTYYRDADGDEYGDNGDFKTQPSCDDAPVGYVLNNQDCDDTNINIRPGGTQIAYRVDNDGDGYGAGSIIGTTDTCVAPEGHALNLNPEDCDDNNPNVNPGATEIANDGLDNDCDGNSVVINQGSSKVWIGPDIHFAKPGGNKDWTDPLYQDKITEDVIITMQDKMPIYNYQWWQDTFGADAVHDGFINADSDLMANLDNDPNVAVKDINQISPSGGPKRMLWAILDDTGFADNDASDNFTAFGTLGDPEHFYSLNNITSILHTIRHNIDFVAVNNAFSITTSNNQDFNGGSSFLHLENKQLGVWLPEEDIYFSLMFTTYNEFDEDLSSFSYIRSTPGN